MIGMMAVRARYPAGGLCVVAFAAFLGWAWSSWMIVNIGIDLKYLESETAMHLGRQAEWSIIRSRFGWALAGSCLVLSFLLIYRWFIKPSAA